MGGTRHLEDSLGGLLISPTQWENLCRKINIIFRRSKLSQFTLMDDNMIIIHFVDDRQ
jgi:hypothetical protein